MSALCHSQSWEEAKPATIISLLELLGELKVDPARFFPHASPSIAAIVPTMSIEEGCRLKTALQTLGLPFDVRELDFEDSQTDLHSLLERSWRTMSISSCKRLTEKFPDDLTISRFVGMRCITDVRIASLEQLLFFIAISYVPLRNAVVNRLHELLPSLTLSEVLTIHNSTCGLEGIILLHKELLRKVGELSTCSEESVILLKVLTLPIGNEVKNRIRGFFEDQMRVIDLDVAVGCELFSHLGDVAESAVISQCLIDKLSARLFLSINELSCVQCCDLLEDIELVSESCNVPGAFIEKLRSHFYIQFQKETTKQSGPLPLVLLRRFALCGRTCTAVDVRALQVLQRECMSCEWRTGPQLKSTCEALRALDALENEFCAV